MMLKNSPRSTSKVSPFKASCRRWPTGRKSPMKCCFSDVRRSVGTLKTLVTSTTTIAGPSATSDLLGEPAGRRLEVPVTDDQEYNREQIRNQEERPVEDLGGCHGGGRDQRIARVLDDLGDRAQGEERR